VLDLPVCCPRCRSEDIFAKGGPDIVPKRENGPYYVLGRWFGSYRVVRYECRGCGQAIARRRFRDEIFPDES
jgi:hypothetical protein